MEESRFVTVYSLASVVACFRRYGLRDVYAEMLHLCRHCNALFWQVRQVFSVQNIRLLEKIIIIVVQPVTAITDKTNQ